MHQRSKKKRPLVKMLMMLLDNKEYRRAEVRRLDHHFFETKGMTVFCWSVLFP